MKHVGHLPDRIRIVCVSDTHNHAPGQGYTLPKGDILIHAGDLTNQGSLSELQQAIKWIEAADFVVKIVVAGNHDLGLDKCYRHKNADGWVVQARDHDACKALMRCTDGIIYLEHEYCEINVHGRVLRVFGSPFSIDHGRQNWAFQYALDDAAKIWEQIPDHVDILITHSPPAGHVDKSTHWTAGGCPTLNQSLKRVAPTLHVCGHHHEGRGAETLKWARDADEQSHSTQWIDPGAGNKRQSLLSLSVPNAHSQGLTTIINASIMKNSFSRNLSKEFNKPIVVDMRWPTIIDRPSIRDIEI